MTKKPRTESTPEAPKEEGANALAVIEAAPIRGPTTPEEFAAAIHAVCRRSAVAVGKLLIEAKEKLPHGAFMAMIEHDLPFGPRTAEKLMVIARDPVLSNPTHESDLSGSWTVLYEMALIDKKLDAPGTLEAWWKNGTVYQK